MARVEHLLSGGWTWSCDGHVTGCAVMELYGFIMEPPIEKYSFAKLVINAPQKAGICL